MPDYDFTGLSPRSFEQLIQAIALQKISSQTIIFGDGTDGGREASYRGKTDYPNEAEPWDGYIVLQAKFRQRPDNDTNKDGKWSKDGNWAVSQLKKELEDFADPKKERRIPEYYIFVTNVVLTAANRLVFLVGLEQDIVGFEIRSLQEFMASEAIMDGSDSQITERLEEIIPIISWRNVVLFAIGKCFTERQYLRDSIHTSCAALNDQDILYTATLAGSRLALDILEDGAVAQQPKYLKLFTRLALNLLDFSPDNFHIQLANIYTESLANIYKEEIEKRVSNQNYQQCLGAWNCLLQLINLGYDWAIESAERYWLQKEEGNLEIISAFIKQDNFKKLNEDHWIAQKIIPILAKVEPFLVEQKIGWQTIRSDFNLLNEITSFFGIFYYRRRNHRSFESRTYIHQDQDNDFIYDSLEFNYSTLWKLDNIQLDDFNEFLKNYIAFLGLMRYT